LHKIVGDEQLDVYLDFVAMIELWARIFILFEIEGAVAEVGQVVVKQ